MKWWIYQRERFPLVAHGPLILAFSSCAVCFSALLRGQTSLSAWPVFLVAFLSSLFSFLHLRIADEFKDAEEDALHRPYRPVPRGLVTLRQLGEVWALTAAVQVAAAIWLAPRLLIPLAVTWIYLALMSREFFCRKWLKARPITYMWSHMLIMPLIDFYATACDWLPSAGRAPEGLFWFVIVSFFNGFVIEIGRKIRAPREEEPGVETYTVLYGPGRAVRAWWIMILLTGSCAVAAAFRIGFVIPVAAVLGAVLAIAVWTGGRFLKAPELGRAKTFETISGVWTLLLYLMLGLVPMGMKYWG